MIVTITGYPGSGKSTLGRGIAKALGLRHYSAGELLRGLAKQKGISLMELHERMEENPGIDQDIDNLNKRLGKRADDFVIDSRLAWHFIPDSIKVFVKINLAKAAERVYRDTLEKKGERSDEKDNLDLEQTRKNLEKRMKMNQARYKRLYNVDYLDESNYDIVVDTTSVGIEETRQKVLEKIKEIQQRQSQ